MPVSLLTAKFRLPANRLGLVTRPRLLQKLEDAWQPGKRLILVSAPAGYGKTTLISEWIAGLQDRVENVWLSLDESDNEPQRFLSYLIGAMKTELATGQSQALQGVLQFAPEAQPGPVQDLLAALLNPLHERARPYLMALDDYGFISNPAIHQIVKFLVHNLPPSMRLAILTRTDPPLGLAQLRARNQVCEIRMVDLRFSVLEASEFLNRTMGLNLHTGDITALETRTEGWIAGLQMAGLMLQGREDSHAFIQAFSGSNRYVLEYLLEEVLIRQPAAIQDFLLQTSILDRLCAPLCDAVLGDQEMGEKGVGIEVYAPYPLSPIPSSKSQTILEHLEGANLFLISLDDQHDWYRYHHLFAGLLRHRLRQTWTTQAISVLHRRACQWYEEQGMVVDAITQALLSPDPEYAAVLLEKHILTFFYHSEVTQVHRWLKALPEALLPAHPLLCAVYAAAIALLPPYPPYSLLAAEKWLDEAEHVLTKELQANALARAFALNIRSYWARFRGEPPEKVIGLIQEALAVLPAEMVASTETAVPVHRDDLCIRSALQTNLGLVYWETGNEQAARQALLLARHIGLACDDLFNASASIKCLATMSYLHGQLSEAASYCREGLKYFDEQQARLGHRAPFSGEIGIQWGEILLEQNELAEAEQILKENMDLAKWTMSHNILMNGRLALARLERGRGNLAAAFAHLDEAEKLSILGSGLAAAQRVCLWLASSRDHPETMDFARQWAQGRSLTEFKEGPPQMEWTISLSLARLNIAEENQRPAGKVKPDSPKLSGTLEWLDRQRRAMHARGWAHWEIQLRVVECLARGVLGDWPGARAALRHAVELAAPGGYIRIFVDEGEPLRPLLAELEKEAGWLAPSLRKLLDAFPDSTAHGPRGTQPPTPLQTAPLPTASLIEPLTPRELEVLHMICQGLSNTEISAALVVSLNTVKKHTHSIFGKLGVSNRAQAILKAQQLGLIAGF